MNAPKRPDDRRPNHLAGQTSPYLLQHLYNPVDSTRVSQWQT